jgi:hypothetical protein
MSTATYKALLCGGISAAMNTLILKEDVMSSIKLGAAVTVGDLAGQYLGAAAIIPVLIPDSSSGLWSGAVVQNRIYEIAGEYAGCYVASTYLGQYGNFGSFQQSSNISKIGMLLISDVAATYLSEFLAGQNESYIA